MNLPTSPRPPKWPYFAGDALLLALACYVGLAVQPLTNAALSAIFGCVALGAVLAAVPFLIEFLADQRAAEAALQDRLDAQNQQLHRAVETLAATAAQIRSAHEAAAKAVHAADTLPYRLQEKIAEFTNQLQARDDEDKAAMAKELEALRDAEGKRLSALAGTIQSATREFAAIEKEARTALEAARREAAEAAPALAAALGGATTRAEAALHQAAAHAQSALGATEERIRDAATAADSAAARLLERTAALRQLEQELDAVLQQRIERLHAAAQTLARSATTPAAEPGHEKTSPAGAEPPVAPAPAAIPPRLKRDPEPPRSEPVAASVNPTEPDSDAAAAEPPVTEPPPKREPRRKPSARSLGEAVLPGFAEPEIVYDAEPASHSAPAKTADGTTRLLVTAYIGIGNKVFVRGEGAGLSWDKGVPMEFVSIGKWSWETGDSAVPLKIQLYKNDDLPAQGDPITLPPGHHIEVTPVFREADPF